MELLGHLRDVAVVLAALGVVVSLWLLVVGNTLAGHTNNSEQFED